MDSSPIYDIPQNHPNLLIDPFYSQTSNHHNTPKLSPWFNVPFAPEFPHKNAAKNVLDLVLEALPTPSPGCHGRWLSLSPRPLGADSKRLLPNDDLRAQLARLLLRIQGKKDGKDLHQNSSQADVFFQTRKYVLNIQGWLRKLDTTRFFFERMIICCYFLN